VHAHGNRVVQTNGYDVSKSMDFSNSRGSNRKDANDNRGADDKRDAKPTITGTFSTIERTPDKQKGRQQQ
jgi:hypothetical protein